MRQEHGSEQCMMLGLHSAALRQALDALGTPAAGAVQRQPMAAGLEPGFQSGALLGARVGAGDVGDEQPAHGQPFLHVGEVVGDGSRNLSLGQQREEPKAGIVVVVTGAGAGRKAAGNDMSAVVDDVGHAMPLFRSMPDAIRESAAASITPPAPFSRRELRRLHPPCAARNSPEPRRVPSPERLCFEGSAICLRPISSRCSASLRSLRS